VAVAVLGCLVLLLLPTSMGLGVSPGPALRAVGPLSALSAAGDLAAARLSAQQGAGPGGVASPPAASHPSAGPNATYSLAIVYDAVDGYVVAVTPNSSGGLHNATYGANDVTWKYSGGNWTVLPTTGAPPELLYPGLVYDGADGTVVLFGGIVIAGSQGSVTRMDYSNQTWSYAGGAWTNRTVANATLPSADSPVQLAYDSSDGYVVLFDESVTGPATMVPTTWTYLAGVWKNVSAPVGTPSPPLDGVMAYDAADGYIVYFGGLAGGPGLQNWWTLNETWEFRGGSWSNITGNVTGAPGGRTFAGITYDPHLARVVVFGGTVWHGPGNYSVANDTWAYSSGAWTNLHLSTPGTEWWTVTLAYDPTTQQLLLAGETNNTTNPTVVSAIWLLGNGSWAPAAPVFLLGNAGADAGTPFVLTVRTGPLPGTASYRYSGMPPGCVGTNSPTFRCTTESPGRYVIHVFVNDSAGFAMALSTSVVVSAPPEITSFEQNLPVAEVGFPVDLRSVTSGGTGALSFVYSGLPAGCPTQNSATLTCVPSTAGPTVVTAQVTDSIGVTSLSSVNLAVSDRPTVTAFEVEPAVTDVGQSVVLAALTSAGVGPSAYSFAGLPSGCSSVDQLSFGCAPSAAGSYVVSFAATDSFGALATGRSTLQVNPLPSIASFVASANQVTIGSSLALSVRWVGGTAPFTFVYSGLPAGCPSADAANIQCKALAPGSSTVTATLIDATGASSSQIVVIEVVPASPSHPTGPGGLLPSGSGPFGAMFVGGLAVGILGLVVTALWARRQLKARAEGEAIVTALRRSNSEFSESTDEPSRGSRETSPAPRNE
jgi:hypothetical protein